MAGGEGRGICHSLYTRMNRKKLFDPGDTQTSLNRCLSAKRLTFIGIGSMVGAGIYVLVGVAAKTLAGPSVIISFLLAAVVVCMTSFCFAEFASCIPKSGNPYVYIYVIYGEFVAFMIGWSSMLSYITGGAICARAWSGYVDSLLNNAIKNFTVEHVGKWSIGDPLSEYPDLLAFLVQFFVLFIAASGAHCSTVVNTVLAILNVAILALVMIMGAVFGDTKNWHDAEHGGFFPFGVAGIMQGTSACFYAFFGFETVCIAAEEAKNPSKSVPRGLIAGILITTLLYVGTAIAFTVLVPFWLVDERAPLAVAFDHVGPYWMKYLISIGPLCGFSNILLLNTYGFARLCFSLSEDGLLWKACAVVNRRTKVPMFATIVGGLSMSFAAMCLQLEHLFRFNVLSTILSYALVCFGIIILRHKSHQSSASSSVGDPDIKERTSSLTVGIKGNTKGSAFCLKYIRKEIRSVALCLGLLTYVYILMTATVLLSALLLWAGPDISQHHWSTLVTMGLIISVIVLCIGALCSCEKSELSSTFKVPFVPLFPLIAGMLNVFFLVAAVDRTSALAYISVVAIGIMIYVGICIWDAKYGTKTLASFSIEEMNTLLLEDLNESMVHQA